MITPPTILIQQNSRSSSSEPCSRRRLELFTSELAEHLAREPNLLQSREVIGQHYTSCVAFMCEHNSSIARKTVRSDP